MHSETTNISSRAARSPDMAEGLKVLIAAGGTGGHVFPAIAIADALQEENSDIEILFVGTKDHMEWEAVPRAGYDITNIWISGFHRRLTLKNLMFPVKLITSMVQSYRIIKQFDPDIVVSCGGYVAGPVGWTASQLGIPLVIQEQNSFPGVTNRLLGKKAEVIFTAFNDAERHFPTGKTTLAGNPIRKALTNVDRHEAAQKFGFDAEQPTLLVLGGSGGARSINEAMAEHIKQLHDEEQVQVIWQCGKRYYDRLRETVQPDELKNLWLVDFLQEMPQAYAVADLVVSRAGALSCSELAVTGTPSILVPSPNVAGDHQTKNARSMVDAGAAVLVEDSTLQKNLAELVKQLLNKQERLESMKKAARSLARPDADHDIANRIIDLATDRNE